jgi:predicted acyltransferase
MVCLIGEGFGLLYFRDRPMIGAIAQQFQHCDWEGMHFWDLIAPFFIFVVGAAMPFSFRRRWESGEPWRRSLLHVFRRCLLLFAFGCLAWSIDTGKPVLSFIDILPQIAFGYFVAFLVLRKRWTVQGAVALGILAGYFALYRFVTAPGVAGPWARDANIGWYLDRLVLHKNWESYVTIICIPTAANVIFGVMAGELLGSLLPVSRKIGILAVAGASALLAGLVLEPVIPMVKKIRTVTFSLSSIGITVLALLLFYWICDVRKRQRWARVFVVVGANSIFIYLFNEILHPWLIQTSLIFTGWAVDMWGPGGRVLNAWIVFLFEIYVCFWLYRRRIFFKV